MMQVDVRALLTLTSAATTVQYIPAKYVGLNADGTVTVNINGAQVPATPTTVARPVVNDPVAVLALDQLLLMLGPTSTPPPRGTVVTAAGGIATLTTDVGTVSATYSGTAPAVGALVKLAWSDGAHILGVLTGTLTPPPVDLTDADGGGTPHTDTFTAVDAGTFQTGRWFQAQPWAVDGAVGAWFYGTKVFDTLQGADVSRIQIYLPIVRHLSGAPMFGVHAYPGKASDPVVQSATAVPVGDSDWYDLPVSLGRFLANNVGGIGLDGGGSTKFASLAGDGQSGALRIDSVY
jgi:hypothetical protein